VPKLRGVLIGYEVGNGVFHKCRSNGVLDYENHNLSSSWDTFYEKLREDRGAQAIPLHFPRSHIMQVLKQSIVPSKYA